MPWGPEGELTRQGAVFIGAASGVAGSRPPTGLDHFRASLNLPTMLLGLDVTALYLVTRRREGAAFRG